MSIARSGSVSWVGDGSAGRGSVLLTEGSAGPRSHVRESKRKKGRRRRKQVRASAAALVGGGGGHHMRAVTKRLTKGIETARGPRDVT